MTTATVAVHSEAAGQRVSPYFTTQLFRGAWLLSVLLVVLFVLKAPAPGQWAVAALLLACGCVLAWQRPVLAIWLLPAPLLIGPITRISGGGAGLHLGDAFLFAVAAVLLLRAFPDGRFEFGEYWAPLSVGALLVAVSWLLSLDPVAAALSLIGVLQFVIVYVLTLTFIRSRADVDGLWWSWIAAVTLSSVLVLVSYARGEILLFGVEANIRDNFAELLVTSTGYFWRATFFVTGFVFPLAVAAVAAFAYIVASESASLRLRLVLLGTLLPNALCLVAMGNKTAMGGAALGMGAAALWALGVRGGLPRAALMLAGFLGVAMLASSFIQQIFPGDQFRLLLERFGSSESFAERVWVWQNVIDYTLNSPGTLLFGLGPDVTIRRIDHPLVQSLFVGRGVAQQAVDSGYLYVVLNYGVLLLLILLVVAAHSFGRLTALLFRQRSAAGIAVWSGMVLWAVMAVTQQHGISKPAILIVQMFAMAQALTVRSSSRTGAASGMESGL